MGVVFSVRLFLCRAASAPLSRSGHGFRTERLGVVLTAWPASAYAWCPCTLVLVRQPRMCMESALDYARGDSCLTSVFYTSSSWEDVGVFFLTRTSSNLVNNPLTPHPLTPLHCHPVVSLRYYGVVRPRKVDCRGRQAERDLVCTLRRPPISPTLRLAPEVVAVSAVSLLPEGGRAALEVPVEGALTARAWLASLVQPVVEAELAPGPGAGLPDGTAAAAAAASVNLAGEHSQVEVWAVMLQALRGLAAVHAISEDSIHRAVCLANILVAARSSPDVPAGTAQAAASASAAGVPPSPTTQPLHGFRRAQLGPPAPAALAHPSAGCIAPEVVRGQGFGQPADVYAFGCALRAACCGARHKESFYATGGVGRVDGGSSGGGAAGGKQPGVLPTGLGPSYGPLRQALVQLLESMLEEDVSRRCTALEVCYVRCGAVWCRGRCFVCFCRYRRHGGRLNV